jgi:hypothetical protein
MRFKCIQAGYKSYVSKNLFQNNLKLT